MENYNENDKTITTVSESAVKRLQFVITAVPIIVSLLFVLAIFMQVKSDIRKEGVPYSERRDTCFYTDDVDWDSATISYLEHIYGPMLVEKDDGGITFRFDGIDKAYEGECEVVYLFDENGMTAVVAYIPYSDEAMKKLIDYYGAKKADNAPQYYLTFSGDNDIIFSKNEDEICLIVEPDSQE